MSNHLHLLVQTPKANLSEFMRLFAVFYTVRFNRRNGRSGHVFQGRFKSLFKVFRRMAMELSYRYSNYNQKEIGAIFGVDYSTVSQNRVGLKNKLKSSRKLKKQFDQFLEHIDNMSN